MEANEASALSVDTSSHIQERPRPSKPATGGSFKPGDPRIRGGRLPGEITRKKREAQELLIAECRVLVERMLVMTKDPPPEEQEPCALCGRGMGRPDEVKLKAIIAALDRAGIGPKSSVEVEVKQDAQWLGHATVDELVHLRGIRDACLARMAQEADAG